MITPEETYGRMRKLYCPRADEWLTEEHITLSSTLFKITPLRLSIRDRCYWWCRTHVHLMKSKITWEDVRAYQKRFETINNDN